MSVAYYLARRIHYEQSDNGRVSRPAVRIAVLGIALGVAVMLLTVAIVVGFKNEVQQRVVGFGGHMQLQSMVPNQTYELPPITVNDTTLARLLSLPGITGAEPYITKPAVVQGREAFVGVVLRSDTTLTGRQVRPSQTLMRQLQVDADSTLTATFVQTDAQADAFALGAQPTTVKQRRLEVCGTFETHFSEIDRQMIYCAPDLLQAVNGWDDETYSAIRIDIDDTDRLMERYTDLCLSEPTDAEGQPLLVQRIDQLNPQVFSWLELLDTNVWVIVVLMSVVSAFTMIGGLLIIILERTRMIGILKAQGLDNTRLRHTFLWVGFFLTARGLLLGYVLGLGLCFVQWRWHLLTLDPKDYYLEWVPISLPPAAMLAVGLGTIAVTLVVLIAPTAVVSRIDPARVVTTE